MTDCSRANDAVLARSSADQHIAMFSGGADSTAMVLRLVEEKAPLDEVVYFDTGWDFPAMAEHIDTVERAIDRRIVRLHPNESFKYKLMLRPVHARDGSRCRIGYGWPSVTRRWCTSAKVAALDKHCKRAIRYVGYAADEAHRASSQWTKRHTVLAPLIDWDMTGADCVAYCRERGFTWGGLYEIFGRVSCYCCPLQPLGGLRKLREHFPVLWTRMLAWELRIADPKSRRFRGERTLHDLDRRFASEQRQSVLALT